MLTWMGVVVLWLQSLLVPSPAESMSMCGSPDTVRAPVHSGRTLMVEPPCVTMNRGDTRELRAVLHDPEGNHASPSDVEWESHRPHVARITRSGLVQARALGSTAIVARSGKLADTAHVKVVEAPPASGERETSNHAELSFHEPDGFRPLTLRRFEAGVEDGWTASGSLDLKIISDPYAPRSEPHVGQIRFPAGFEGGRTPTWTTREGIEQHGFRELYLSFWVKLSDNWQGHRTGVNKIGYVWLHGQPVVVPNYHVRGHGPVSTQLRLENTPDGARNLQPNSSDPKLRRGEWHRWEILLVVNTGDHRDGAAHWWIDGFKVGEYRNVAFGSALQSKSWENIAWRPTWGGRGDTVTSEMYMWMDHLYASGRR